MKKMDCQKKGSIQTDEVKKWINSAIYVIPNKTVYHHCIKCIDGEKVFYRKINHSYEDASAAIIAAYSLAISQLKAAARRCDGLFYEIIEHYEDEETYETFPVAVCVFDKPETSRGYEDKPKLVSGYKVVETLDVLPYNLLIRRKFPSIKNHLYIDESFDENGNLVYEIMGEKASMFYSFRDAKEAFKRIVWFYELSLNSGCSPDDCEYKETCLYEKIKELCAS